MATTEISLSTTTKTTKQDEDPTVDEATDEADQADRPENCSFSRPQRPRRPWRRTFVQNIVAGWSSEVTEPQGEYKSELWIQRNRSTVGEMTVFAPD
jgi:hypothetical protein